MKNLKVVNVSKQGIEFSNDFKLYSQHESDCCESHELNFDDLTMSDFEGLEFDLTTDSFFKKIPEFGIELIPIHGHSIKIPGHAYNNGYYSTNLKLVVECKPLGIKNEYDIEECQIDKY